MSHFYILDDDGKPKSAEVEEWGRWFEDNKRVLKQTILEDETLISTVFLGIDHSFGGGPLVLWECKAFVDGEDEWCVRYSFRDDATLGHEAMVYLANVRNTSLGRALLCDWDEAWSTALMRAKVLGDEET